MTESSTLPRAAILSIAFIQGILLFALYRAFDTNAWPSQSPLWSYPLWTIVTAIPLLLLLSIDRANYVAAARQAILFGIVLALLAMYTGRQAEPHGMFPVGSLTFVFAASTALACFKALMYLQQRASGMPLTYEVLFTNSWRNFLVTALSALFVLVFWLILLLWGQLFKVIDIDFFYELFTEDWFSIPVLTLAFGLGVSIFRGLTQVIDNIASLLHWLIKLLLPLVVAVAVIFLASLPFVGLDVLWSTGHGTALLLWLLAITLFFTNAVYQDGRESEPYPVIVHRLIFSGLCVTPAIAALSLYGLSLRLDQYGWTVERCWAFVVWLILSLFALGYVTGIVRKRDDWTHELARVNTAMGLVVLVIMLLANSPLLDFRKISLASQLGRVDSGEIELREFDFWYARHHLVRPAHLALEEIKADIGDTDAELLAMIEMPTRRWGAQAVQNLEQMWSSVVYRPEPFDPPNEVKTIVEQQYVAMGQGEAVMFRIDLDDDGQHEYLLLLLHDFGIAYSQFFYLRDDAWHHGDLQHSAWNFESGDVRQMIEDGDIRFVEPDFKHVEIGGIVLRPVPRN